MKKVRGVVLLISLFFISAISVLILQHLEDSESFFDIVQTSSDLSQTNITVNNVKNEILDLFDKKTSDDIVKFMLIIPEILPLNFKDISLVIEVGLLDLDSSIYIYKDKNKLTEELYEKELYYPDDFLKLIHKKDHNITNFRQLDYIIDEYVTSTKDKNILNIKNEFTFMNNESGELNENNQSVEITYISCKYDMNINNLKSHVDMIVEIKNKKSKLKYFDFYFKEDNE